jgi:HK97 family phage prohead protease
MPMKINSKAVSQAKRLIREGKINTGADWGFDAGDSDAILESVDNDWSKYALWFLVVDEGYDEETKARYKYPYGKGGKIWRRAVIAIKSRAAQQDWEELAGVADDLLEAIDEKEEKGMKVPVRDNLQYRSREVEIRAAKTDEDEMIAEGMAILYNDEVVLWGTKDLEEREVILAGAATESIQTDDWRSVWNHQNDIVLGRVSNGTLEVEESDAGVQVKIHFPDSEEGRSKFHSIQRGDVREMSFAFVPVDFTEERIVEGEKTIWKTTISKMQVFEVSPVTFPAYANTTISARMAERRKQIQAEASAKDQAAAAAADRAATLREMEITKLF